MTATVPMSDVNPFDADVRQDPYAFYHELQEAGPVVHLTALDLFAVSRFADVQRVLADQRVFSSAQGVAQNAAINGAMAGSIVCTDPPDHARLRGILGRPLTPAKLAPMREDLARRSEGQVARLLSAGEPVEAVSSIASFLPLTVVTDLVGMPDDATSRMLTWAAAGFNGMGPDSLPATGLALATMGEMMEYVSDPTLPGRLRRDSWSAGLHAASICGEIPADQFPSMLQGYLTPSLDTTIFAMSNLLWLLATHPEQWEMLRAQPNLVPRAIHEAIRMESPVQFFSRVATEDTEVDGAPIKAGSRVFVMYAAANRDPRRYDEPDRFRIDRDSNDHVGFGHSAHRCVGMNLAIMELTAMLRALVRQVAAIELVDQKRADNAILRGFENLVLRLTPSLPEGATGANPS
jgi:cytochrome P450